MNIALPTGWLRLGSTSDLSAVPWIRLEDNQGKGVDFAPPILPWGLSLDASNWKQTSERQLSNGARELSLVAPLVADPAITQTLTVRIAPDHALVRFQVSLACPGVWRGAADGLRFLACDVGAFSHLDVVELSAFDELTHSHLPVERRVDEAAFAQDMTEVGPVLVGSGHGQALVLAYEHGSQTNDPFLRYHFLPGRQIELRSVQGCFARGEALAWESPWFIAGVVSGGVDEAAAAFRDFLLRYQALSPATREPLICYNTWNRQERVKAWEGKPYLSGMNETRMLAEIEIAAQMGIDVFVLDTGWYEKTGDWTPSRERFPRGLGPLRERLSAHGMRLGLWFGPLHAAISSQVRAAHEDCLMTHDGQPGGAHPVWETEASQNLCLVSRWGDAFADELIRLHRETGVDVFKWDAIGQYGCDHPGHGHGGVECTADERRARYAFLLPLVMARIVERVAAACPQAIVDFDVTESGRAVGLAFLAAGRYFLINNGPYFPNYDLPLPADGNFNLFFRPGAARAAICRQALAYDRWLPTCLTLVHYLPDDTPAETTVHHWLAPSGFPDSLEVNLASVVLGQHGIWGDLVAVSTSGVARMRALLDRYRLVRSAAQQAAAVVTGRPGMSREVHERLHGGRGVVVLFATHRGSWDYVTTASVAASEWCMESMSGTAEVARLPDGRARIRVAFDRPGARVVCFGV